MRAWQSCSVYLNRILKILLKKRKCLIFLGYRAKLNFAVGGRQFLPIFSTLRGIAFCSMLIASTMKWKPTVKGNWKLVQIKLPILIANTKRDPWINLSKYFKLQLMERSNYSVSLFFLQLASSSYVSQEPSLAKSRSFCVHCATEYTHCLRCWRVGQPGPKIWFNCDEKITTEWIEAGDRYIK